MQIFLTFFIMPYLTGITPSSKHMKTLLGFAADDNIALCNAVSGNVNFDMFVSVRFLHVSALEIRPPMSRVCPIRSAALIKSFLISCILNFSYLSVNVTNCDNVTNSNWSLE